jgi:hypothetical protein
MDNEISVSADDGAKRVWRGVSVGVAWGFLSDFFVRNLIDDFRGKEATMKALADSWYDCPWQIWPVLWLLTLVAFGTYVARLRRRPTVGVTVTVRGPVAPKALDAAAQRAIQVVDTTIRDHN